VERAVILCQSKRIEKLDLDSDMTVPPPSAPAPAPAKPPLDIEPADQELSDFLARCERRYLEAMLEKTRGSIKKTARAAGVNPKTLYLKIRKHGLSKMDYRPSAKAKGGQSPEHGRKA
jgi:two-component system response regulator AtoC